MRQTIKILMNTLEKGFQNSRPLGRWHIDYCPKKIDNKIDWANIDHCGTCGEYAQLKYKDSNKTSTNNLNKGK